MSQPIDQTNKIRIYETWKLLVPFACALAFIRASYLTVATHYMAFAGSSISALLFIIAVCVLLIVLYCVIPEAKEITLPEALGIHGLALGLFSGAVIIMGVLCVLSVHEPSLLVAGLFFLATLASFWSMYAWLYALKGASPRAVIVILFSALIISEGILFFLALIPWWLQLFATVPLMVSIVFLRMQVLSKETLALSRGTLLGHSVDAIRKYVGSSDYLISCSLALIMLGISSGILSFFPGQEMTYPAPLGVQICKLLLICAVSFSWIVRLHQAEYINFSAVSWGFCLVLGVAALADMLIFPQHALISSVCALTLSSYLTILLWYLLVLCMSAGDRPALVYTLAGVLIFSVARMVGKSIAALGLLSVTVSPVFICAGALSFLLLVQVYMICRAARARAKLVRDFLDHPKRQIQIDLVRPSLEERAAISELPAIIRFPNSIKNFMGLQETALSLADMRFVAMQGYVAQIAKEFLLTPREQEILVLFALGRTQAGIAQELDITKGTVQSHMRRIYEKTDFHSRNDVLTYIEDCCGDTSSK